jgi:hypothetical protein
MQQSQYLTHDTPFEVAHARSPGAGHLLPWSIGCIVMAASFNYTLEMLSALGYCFNVLLSYVDGEQAMNKAAVIERVCQALQRGGTSTAAQILSDHYPNPAPPIGKANVGVAKRLRVFRRDRFLDRYSGSPLVLPGALRDCFANPQ